MDSNRWIEGEITVQHDMVFKAITLFYHYGEIRIKKKL
jgi:hypothetical protein